MNSAPSNDQKRQKTSVPPRRGQIKAQILESLVESVSSVASKAGGALSKLKKPGNDGVRSPASTTPPPSAYTSDGSPSQS